MSTIMTSTPNLTGPTPELAPAVEERRLRIAYVVHDYNRKLGHSRYVAELASRFKFKHDVHVYANTFEEPNPLGLTFHHVSAWRRSALVSILSFILPATWSIRGHYDIIHAQGVCGLRYNVLTAHICQSAWYEAMVRYTGRANWRKRLFHAVTEQLERWTFRSSSARRIIAVSGRIRDDLWRHYGRKDGVCVIPHGVDIEAFHPENLRRWRSGSAGRSVSPRRPALPCTSATPRKRYRRRSALWPRHPGCTW